jgi:hypothetical protein
MQWIGAIFLRLKVKWVVGEHFLLKIENGVGAQVAHRLCFRSVTDLFLRVCKLFGVRHFYRLSYRSVTDP